ncbi:MAG: TIGR04283 family arsenosugar biosynthesis glycosyltransferase [Nitrospirota bacterium]
MKEKYGLSIIIPVLSESKKIEDIIEHLKNLDFDGSLEIIVVDGSPGGDTIKLIGDEFVLKIISAKGRGRQMNSGASVASGEILLFLHADTYLPEDALHRIWNVMKNHKYMAGAFDLGIRSERFIFRIIENFSSLRSRLTRVPYGDQAIFIRKEYFERIGGYKDIPLMEDVDLMKRIRKRKDKICLIKEKVKTSPRRWEKEGVVFCTLRNWTILFLYSLGIPPEKLAKYYK